MNFPARMAPAPSGVPYDDSKYLPSGWLECIFYVQMFYSIIGPALGIVFGRIGIVTLLGLAAMCALSLREKLTLVLVPLVLPLACGVSFIAVQVFLGESVSGFQYFVPWMLNLVIAQWLARRRGFLHRAALVVVFIGFSMLPFLISSVNERMALERAIPVANPNDLGAWFGFCAVYFAVLGLEARRTWIRVISLVLSVAWLLAVGLTVSRTPLAAAAICILLAMRRMLKRGFLPLLLLAGVAALAFTAGLFDQASSSYAARGLEETGRLLVWPIAIGRFLRSPFTGVGVSHIETYVASVGSIISPHNGFIYIGIASGIVPLAFFVAYWVRLFNDLLRLNKESHPDAPFFTPLLLYAFLNVMSLNAAFMASWVVVTFCAIGQAGFLSRVSGIFEARKRARDTAGGWRAAKVAHGART